MRNLDETERPMGRVARKRAALRQKLLAHGLVSVADYGFAALKISELADAADCSVGAFYTHFDSKEHFFGALKAHYLDRAGEVFDSSYLEDQDPRIALTAKFRYALQLVVRNPAWGRLVLASAWFEDPTQEGLSARVLGDIRRGVAEGLLHVKDEFAALSLVTGAFSASVIAVSGGKFDTLNADAIAYHILVGLGVPAELAEQLSTVELPSFPEVERIILGDTRAAADR